MKKWLTAEIYAAGVFLIAVAVEFFTLKSPGFEFPVVRIIWAAMFYTFPLIVAGWASDRMATARTLPVLDVPLRLMPFGLAAALYGVGCAWVSRDLTEAPRLVAALPLVSLMGWLTALAVLQKMPARVPAWAVNVLFAAACVAVVIAGNAWLPGLNTMLKWWCVCLGVCVGSAWIARSSEQPSFRNVPLWVLILSSLGLLEVQSIPTRFGTSPARSAAGWAVVAATFDGDSDGFFAAPGADCDDTNARKHPASIAEPCGPAVAGISDDTKWSDSDHVFVFIIDAMRADVLVNHPESVPNLAKLAAESVVFDNAYAPGNATLLSLPAMLTGVSPVAMVDAMKNGDLQIQHYQQGRWIFDLDPRACGGMVVQAHDYADWLFKVYPKPDVTLFFTDSDERGHGAPNAVPRFKDALDRCGDRRKTIVVYIDDPHIENDMTYACEDGSRGGHACYLGEISVVDHAIGEMLAELRSRPKMERTTIIVTSDHGEAFGEHRHVAHASSVYEEQIHVPLIISHPRLSPRHVAVPVSTLGLAATVASETYADRPAQRYPSLIQALEGSYPAPIAYNLVGLAKLAWTAPSAAIRVDNKKVILDFITGRAVMYLLDKDPLEQNPLDAPPDLVQELWKAHDTLSHEAKR